MVKKAPAPKKASPTKKPARPAAAPAVDGRKTRGDQNRQAIVNALAELIKEGQIAPTAEAVSEKAGVGLRTVFRHFSDMESLYSQIGGYIQAIVAPVMAQPVEGKSTLDKLMNAVDRRSDVFEKIMPFHIASLSQRHQSEYLADQQAQYSTLQKKLLESFLPKTVLKDKELVDGLNLIMSIDAWVRLRKDQKLSKPAAKKVMARCVQQLIK